MSADQHEPPYDARQIANLFLEVAEAHGIRLTNMSINKLVFFAHAHYLSERSMSLVHNPLEAWDHGPVAPALYEQFKQFGAAPVTTRATILDVVSGIRRVAATDIAERDRAFVLEVFETYGRLDAFTLSNLSHENGGPWHRARQAFETSANFGKRISNEVIQETFRNAVRH